MTSTSAAALLLLLALAGFAHAWFTPASVPFAAVEQRQTLVGSKNT